MLCYMDKSEIIDILRDDLHLANVSIDAYMLNPYIFVLRSTEKSLTAYVDDERIIMRRNDKHKTNVVNIPCDSVEDVRVKLTEDYKYRVSFNVNNVCYSVFAEVC